MVCALLFTCTAALTAMPLWAVLACLFTVGASYSMCYYLPVGAFCIEFGGQWCATLSGLLDVASYMSAALCAVTFTVFVVVDARSHEVFKGDTACVFII
jgi:hypothetical protein